MAIQIRFFFCSLAFLGFTIDAVTVKGQSREVRIHAVDSGWARNSVNAVVFRKNSLTSWQNTQYISYYDKDGYVVVGKRNLSQAAWEVRRTMFKGNVNDAHNSISIATDGAGYLHISWDHHNTPLKYARSLEPGALEFATMPMTGIDEERVSYPEFFRMPNGNLIFLYRSGQSGEGRLNMNIYDQKKQQWSTVYTNLIDGEGQRNAYWQAYVDAKGIIHLSWVWRESPDVASNHDLCYARSIDAGKTWTTSTGKKYTLPITATSAEYVCRIPERSELINQTSMCADAQGKPYIASYWKESKDRAPQYHVLYPDGTGWQNINLDFRTLNFSLGGQGTKSIPISRPQIVIAGSNENAVAHLIFRDAETNNMVSIATTNLKTKTTTVRTLTDYSIGAWEPSYDADLWKSKNILHLFLQKVQQADGEGMTNANAEMVSVLEWTPQ